VEVGLPLDDAERIVHGPDELTLRFDEHAAA
jgi:hypothetical protein